MRPILYDTVSIGFLLGTVYFFYRSVEFLAQKDYVAGIIALAIGFLVVKAGVEIGKLAILARRDEREA